MVDSKFTTFAGEQTNKVKKVPTIPKSLRKYYKITCELTFKSTAQFGNKSHSVQQN